MAAFFLKKIISVFLQPMQLCLLLGFLGLYLLWFTKKYNFGRILLSVSFLVLLIFSLGVTSHKLLKNLESQYLPLQEIPEGVNTIVVLGGGFGGNIHYPANTRINSASLSRLVEGVRLYRILETNGVKPVLILSGGRVFRSYTTEAENMKNSALILGVALPSMIVENGSLDTYEEALYLKSRLQDKPFILVTSATHMPRAMALFKKQGMHPIPAPTQYFAIRNLGLAKYIPDSRFLNNSEIALHEYIGLVWEWFRKQI